VFWPAEVAGAGYDAAVAAARPPTVPHKRRGSIGSVRPRDLPASSFQASYSESMPAENPTMHCRLRGNGQPGC